MKYIYAIRFKELKKIAGIIRTGGSFIQLNRRLFNTSVIFEYSENDYYPYRTFVIHPKEYELTSKTMRPCDILCFDLSEAKAIILNRKLFKIWYRSCIDIEHKCRSSKRLYILKDNNESVLNWINSHCVDVKQGSFFEIYDRCKKLFIQETLDKELLKQIKEGKGLR